MKNIIDFSNVIDEKILLKCKNYHLNPDIIHREVENNMVIIQIPSFYTFVSNCYFKGENKNYYDVLFDVDSYLEEGIKKLFTSEIKITDNDYLRRIDEYATEADLDQFSRNE